METVFEAVFAVGFLVVLGSAGALLAGRIGSRVLRWITGGLIIATGIAIAVAG